MISVSPPPEPNKVTPMTIRNTPEVLAKVKDLGLKVKDNNPLPKFVNIRPSGYVCLSNITEYMFMYHEQDCCEYVRLEDFELTQESIEGGLVLDFREEVKHGGGEHDSETWTFYHLDTTAGSLWMRWLGEFNGYYSEEVICEFVENVNA